MKSEPEKRKAIRRRLLPGAGDQKIAQKDTWNTGTTTRLDVSHPKHVPVILVPLPPLAAIPRLLRVRHPKAFRTGPTGRA